MGARRILAWADSEKVARVKSCSTALFHYSALPSDPTRLLFSELTTADLWLSGNRTLFGGTYQDESAAALSEMTKAEFVVFGDITPAVKKEMEELSALDQFNYTAGSESAGSFLGLRRE